MLSLDGCKGFTMLQSTAGMLVAAVFTGTALHYLPGILDNADHQVARHAAAAEAMHQAVWAAWNQGHPQEASDASPEPIRHGFEVRNNLVHSPLDGYCFSPADPLATLDLCQTLTAE